MSALGWDLPRATSNAAVTLISGGAAGNWPSLGGGSALTRCGRCRCVLGTPGMSYGLPVACLCPGLRARDYYRRDGLGACWWFGRTGARAGGCW